MCIYTDFSRVSFVALPWNFIELRHLLDWICTSNNEILFLQCDFIHQRSRQITGVSDLEFLHSKKWKIFRFLYRIEMPLFRTSSFKEMANLQISISDGNASGLCLNHMKMDFLSLSLHLNLNLKFESS